MFIKQHNLIFTFLLLAKSLSAFDQSTIADVKSLYLQAFEDISSPNKSFVPKTIKEAITIQKDNINERQKRSFIFSFLEQGNFPESIQNVKLDKTFLKKMEFFLGGEDVQYSLLKRISNTQTSFGEVILACMLALPTHDATELQNRISILQALIRNPDLLQQLDAILKEIKSTEEDVLSYFQEENAFNENLFNSVYFFEFLKLNKNALALDINAYKTILLNGFAAYGLPLYMGYKLKNWPKLYYNNWNLLSTQEKAFLPFQVGASVGLLGFSSYINHEVIVLQKNIYHLFQTKLIGVAKYLRSIGKLRALVQKYPVLLNMPLLQEAHVISDNKLTMSADFKKLVSLLSTKTFKGKPSFLSHHGRTLAAHKIMKEVKQEFIPTFLAVGQVDAYVSIVKLLIKFKENRVHYCFAEFIEKSEKPYIEANNFWNPFINPEEVITNSIQLGGEGINNVILTGPNTGGKSTVLKGLLIDILLAQTFGIAAAERFVCTPFANINCYLNITDDIATGVSLFKAEVLRAKALIESIKNLSTNLFSFTIMDEVFSGTSPQEGEMAAYKFAQELGKFDNSICFIATHFPQLTNLDQDDNFKNYQVTVVRQEDGSLIRPFKLEEGKSTINIAFDLLQQAGVF